MENKSGKKAITPFNASRAGLIIHLRSVAAHILVSGKMLKSRGSDKYIVIRITSMRNNPLTRSINISKCSGDNILILFTVSPFRYFSRLAEIDLLITLKSLPIRKIRRLSPTIINITFPMRNSKLFKLLAFFSATILLLMISRYSPAS